MSNDEWTFGAPATWWGRFKISIVEGEDETPVARAYGDTIEEALSRARLITAAPRMLSAIKGLRVTNVGTVDWDDLKRLQALVREAEGEEAAP